MAVVTINTLVMPVLFSVMHRLDKRSVSPGRLLGQAAATAAKADDKGS